MKKLSIIIISAFSLMLFSGSCKKANDNVSTPPTITISNSQIVKDTIKLEIRKETSIKIDYQINATTGISGLAKYINLDYTIIDVPAGSNQYTSTFDLPIPLKDATYKVKIHVRDNNGSESSQMVVVVVKNLNVGLLTFMDFLTGGSNSVNPSQIDANTGTGYTGSSVNGDDKIRALIDFVCENTVIDDGTLNSRWGTTKNTGAKFTVAPFTYDEFISMSDDSQLISLTASQTSVPIVPSTCILFQLKSGKKGLIWIVSYESISTDTKIHIKIQK